MRHTAWTLGEDGLRLTRPIGQRVADVMGGVTGGVQHLEAHLADVKHIAVADAGVLEGDVAAHRQHVGRAGPPAQLQSTV